MPMNASADDRPIMRRYLGQWRFLLVLPRSLILQTAYPAVGAGVAEYSSFQPHLWRRLHNTLLSAQRMVYGDLAEREREVARLQRMHRRIIGVDEHSRPYSGLDPSAQTWVLLTLFDAVTTLCRLSGEPLSEPDRDRLYDEFLGMASDFGIPEAQLPSTADDFQVYFDRIIGEELELTAAAKSLLDDFVANAPRPRVFDSWQQGWEALRGIAKGPANTILRTLLPSALRERFELSLPWYAQFLTEAVFRLAALATRALPDGRAFMPYAAGKLAATGRAPDPHTFFTEVLDQTGNGFVTWPDFAAMARQIAAQFDASPQTEASLYAAFEAWWLDLLMQADTSCDDRIELSEWSVVSARLASAPPAAADALGRLAREMFLAADTNGDGVVSAEEYERLFGGRLDRDRIADAFDEMSFDGDRRITEEEFIAAVRGFLLGTRRSSLVTATLAAA